MKINCAAIPGALLESELFGRVRGSFTARRAATAAQTADGGTSMLDEVGELPLDLQAKLLRVLQEGTFEPVGSDRTVRADVRVIAATHVDLARAVAEGEVSRGPLYRLDVFPLTVPPLRERPEDLPRSARRSCASSRSAQAARAAVTEAGIAQAPRARLAGQRPRAGQRAGARDDPLARRGGLFPTRSTSLCPALLRTLPPH